MGKTISIEVRGQTFECLPEKAIFWHQKKTLLIADLHLGKSEYFQKHSIPVPSGVLQSDLKNLSSLLQTYEVERLMILGDLIHSIHGISEEVSQTFQHWRGEHSQLEIDVLLGNHDKKVEGLATFWALSTFKEINEDDFNFRHEWIEKENKFVWAGHVHPMFSITTQSEKLRVPCFWLRPQGGILPSFSEFTRGQDISMEKGDQVILATPVGCVKI